MEYCTAEETERKCPCITFADIYHVLNTTLDTSLLYTLCSFFIPSRSFFFFLFLFNVAWTCDYVGWNENNAKLKGIRLVVRGGATHMFLWNWMTGYTAPWRLPRPPSQDTASALFVFIISNVMMHLPYFFWKIFTGKKHFRFIKANHSCGWHKLHSRWSVFFRKRCLSCLLSPTLWRIYHFFS